MGGPPHVSLRDRGLTFATSTGPGVCVRFRTPARGIEPLGLVSYPALTVTVDQPELLVEMVERLVTPRRPDRLRRVHRPRRQ